MPFPNYHGKKRFWTRERVIAGLELAAGELGDPLPCSDDAYLKLKKGRLDWPSIGRIYEYFGSLAGGWFAIGVPKKELHFGNQDWTEAEEAYVLEHAGIKTLASIGADLGRSYGAVKKRLQQLGTTARGNQGLFSAAEISREYDCCYDRVRRFIAAGLIRASYDRTRNRWEIDPRGIGPDVWERLKEPRITYKTFPMDRGDYDLRHHLKRTIINGKVVRVSAPAPVPALATR